MEHLTELIVANDHALQIVDKQPFQSLIKYVRPNIDEKDLPHRTKMRDYILEKAQTAILRMQQIIAVSV